MNYSGGKRQRDITDYYKMPGVVNYVGKNMRKRSGAKIYRSLGVAAREHAFKRVGTPIVLNQSGTVGGLPDIITGTSGITIGNVGTGYVANCVQFGGALSFQLANLVNSSEITSLFDNYRIKNVKLRFDFSYNTVGDVQVPGAPNPNMSLQSLPFIHITPDFDDDTLPSNSSDVLQHSFCKSRRFYDGGFKMTISPRAQQTISGGVGTAGGMLPRSTWLDCNSPAIKHYGVKFWMTDVPALGIKNAWSLTITPIYYIEAKNVA